MDPNGNESLEKSISIKDMLLTLLKNLGIILMAGIILGGAMFGYKYTKHTRSVNVLDVGSKLSGESDVDYQLRVKNVNRAKDIVNSIGKINNQIDNQRRYLTDSLYMQVDAENVYQATLEVVLVLGKDDANGLDTAIIGAYERDIKTGGFLKEYADSKGTRADYILDLITFTSTAANTVNVNLDDNYYRAGAMYITVFGASQEYVNDVMDLVIKEIEKVHADLFASLAKHDISFIGPQSVVKSDSVIRDGQANQTAKLETLQKQIVTYNDALDKVASEIGVADRNEIFEYFDGNKDASAPAVSSGSIKSAVKFCLIGFAGGIFIAAVCYILKYLFGKKIATQAQFFNRFVGIRKIGVLKPSGKRCKFDEALEIKSEDDSKLSSENTFKLISANYGNLTRDYNKILITGTGDKKAISEAVKALGIKGDLKGDIFSDPDVLKNIQDYDGVVLFEQRKVSQFKNVENEITLIRNSGTEIIGAVII